MKTKVLDILKNISDYELLSGEIQKIDHEINHVITYENLIDNKSDDLKNAVLVCDISFLKSIDLDSVADLDVIFTNDTNSSNLTQSEKQKIIDNCQKNNLILVEIHSFKSGSGLTKYILDIFNNTLFDKLNQFQKKIFQLAVEVEANEISKCINTFFDMPNLILDRSFMPIASHKIDKLNQALITQLEEIEENYDFSKKDYIEIKNKIIIPIIVSEMILGFIVLKKNNALNKHLNDIILETINNSLQLLFDNMQKSNFYKFEDYLELLRNLLVGIELSTSEIENIEQFFSLDVFESFVVTVFNSKESIRVKPGIYEKNKIYIEIDNSHVLIFPPNEPDLIDIEFITNEIHRVLKSTNKDISLIQAGIGRLAYNTIELSKSYKEARQALIIGNLLNNENPDINFINYYPNLGVKRLLYLIYDHPELTQFYIENLKVLEDYDQENESDLLMSLKVYLDHGNNLNSAARALFIHRHTLNYRLEQMAEILNKDIDNPEVLLNLKIALIIKELTGNNT